MFQERWVIWLHESMKKFGRPPHRSTKLEACRPCCKLLARIISSGGFEVWDGFLVLGCWAPESKGGSRWKHAWPVGKMSQKFSVTVGSIILKLPYQTRKWCISIIMKVLWLWSSAIPATTKSHYNGKSCFISLPVLVPRLGNPKPRQAFFAVVIATNSLFIGITIEWEARERSFTLPSSLFLVQTLDPNPV